MTMTTGTDAALYRLLAWMSPSFPIGAFSYSHALEMAVEDGTVRDRATLVSYVRTVLTRGAGRCDAGFLVLALNALTRGDDDAFVQIAEYARAMRGSAELALESTAQGEAFAATIAAAWPSPELARRRALLAERGIAPVQPIAVALAGAAIDSMLLVPAFLHALLANLVSAGVRLIPLGQTDGQIAIAALESEVATAASCAFAMTSLADIASAAPAIDLLSMRHETQYTRLFRS
jgi:urease accessory protein